MDHIEQLKEIRKVICENTLRYIDPKMMTGYEHCPPINLHAVVLEDNVPLEISVWGHTQYEAIDKMYQFLKVKGFIK